MSRPFSPAVASNLSGNVPWAFPSIQMDQLQAIFRHVVEWPTTPWTERCPTLAYKALRREPFRLASVCTVWRDAALQMPGLWSTIHLTDSAVRDPVAYVNACLDRSPQWPLDAVVGFSDIGALSTYEAMSIWMRMFQRSSHWQRCHFTFTDALAMTWAVRPAFTPRLEEFVIVFMMPEGSESSSPGDDYYKRPLPHTPGLKRLTFDTICAPPIAIQNLEYLSIHVREPRCSMLWDVLLLTPLLREARIFWPHSQSRAEGRPNWNIVLPKLQRLEIYGHTACYFDASAEKLDLSALHTITVSSYASYTLGALFRRVSPQVHNLILRYKHGSSLSDEDAQAICQLRCLKTIVVRGPQMDYVTGEDMTTGHGTQRFANFFEFLRGAPEMRQLNTLKLVDCKHWRSDMSDITNFEVDFLRDGKGWADPRLALFMRDPGSD